MLDQSPRGSAAFAVISQTLNRLYRAGGGWSDDQCYAAAAAAAAGSGAASRDLLSLLFSAETVEYESEHGLGSVSRSGCGAP